MYDPFLSKEVFADKPWYGEFTVFHAIGVCQASDEHVADIREALARFLFATRTAKGEEPGNIYIIGDGAIETNQMDAYIYGIHLSNLFTDLELSMLDEIQARCDNATPGPWEAARTEIIHPTGEDWLAFYKRAHRADGKIANNIGRAREEQDALLIAHARQDIPFLMDLIARVRKYTFL